jgi:hypothetical protein
MTKAKLRKRIRRLERENLHLIIEANAARARAGEWYQAAMEADAGELLANWPTDDQIRKDLDG